jgi:hypothetical protein
MCSIVCTVVLLYKGPFHLGTKVKQIFDIGEWGL